MYFVRALVLKRILDIANLHFVNNVANKLSSLTHSISKAISCTTLTTHHQGDLLYDAHDAPPRQPASPTRFMHNVPPESLGKCWRFAMGPLCTKRDDSRVHTAARTHRDVYLCKLEWNTSVKLKNLTRKTLHSLNTRFYRTGQPMVTWPTVVQLRHTPTIHTTGCTNCTEHRNLPHPPTL